MNVRDAVSDDGSRCDAGGETMQASHDARRGASDAG
jgi:hypothetical protein